MEHLGKHYMIEYPVQLCINLTPYEEEDLADFLAEIVKGVMCQLRL